MHAREPMYSNSSHRGLFAVVESTKYTILVYLTVKKGNIFYQYFTSEIILR